MSPLNVQIDVELLYRRTRYEVKYSLIGTCSYLLSRSACQGIILKTFGMRFLLLYDIDMRN